MTDTLQPLAELVRGAAVEHLIADYLRAFYVELPDKHIRMNKSGPKYSWAKDDDDQHIPLTYTDLLAHAAGDTTIGAHLHDSAGRCRVGMLDPDHCGRAGVVASIAAAHQLGYVAYGLYYAAGKRAGAEHDGGRLIVTFDKFVNWRDVRAVMEQIRAAAELPDNTEIWPGGGNAVALPFGVHLRKGTRGQLLTQAGEVIDLDSDLAGGFSLVEQLPTNAAPPKVINNVNSFRASDKSDYAKSRSSDHQKSDAQKLSHKVLNLRSAGRIDVKAIGDTVKERYDTEHPTADLLASYGAVQYGQKDFSCPFCEHSHTNTLYTYNGRIYSRSPNCIIPQKQGLNPFGVYVLVEHGNKYMAAVETLAREYGLWVEPAQPRAAAERPQPAPSRTPEQIATYNAARKAQRHDATRRDLDTIYEAACNLEMTSAVPPGASAEAHADRARCLFAYLVTLCSDRGVLQCAPTNEHLCADLEICRRNIVFAFRELEANGLGKRSGGKGGLNQPNEAATWTFYRAPNLGCKPQQEAICTLSILELDLVQDHVLASEGAPSPTHENALADTPEAWQWADDEHSADELNAMEIPHGAESSPKFGELQPTLRQSHGRYQVSDGARFGGWSATPAGAWEQWQPSAELPCWTAIEPAEQPAEIRQIVEFDDSAEPEAASYTPVELPPAPYSGRNKHALDTAARYALVWETMRRLPDADAGDQPEQLRIDQPPAPKARPQTDKPAALDRYLVELAGMSEKELGGEIIKHRRTLSKFKGAHWLSNPGGPIAKLALVEQEIDARELHGVATEPPPSQAPARRPARLSAHQGAMQL